MYLFQETDLSNPLLNNSDNFALSLVFKVTTGAESFVSVIAKVAAVSALENIQFSCHFNERSTLQLINPIQDQVGQRGPPTRFSPVTSTNVGIGPLKVLTLLPH